MKCKKILLRFKQKYGSIVVLFHFYFKLLTFFSNVTKYSTFFTNSLISKEQASKTILYFLGFQWSLTPFRRDQILFYKRTR